MYAMNPFNMGWIFTLVCFILCALVMVYVAVAEYLDGALDDDDIMDYTKDEMYEDAALYLHMHMDEA